MEATKVLKDIDLIAQAGEIREEIVGYVTQIDTAEGSKNQAAVDKREGLTAYNLALADGNKSAMDANISKIAAATETLQSSPAGVEGIQSRIEEFQSRQKELITEARRRKTVLADKVSELTKQLPGAEGVIGNMQALAMEIGKLSDKLRDLDGREKRCEKNESKEASTVNSF